MLHQCAQPALVRAKSGANNAALPRHSQRSVQCSALNAQPAPGATSTPASRDRADMSATRRSLILGSAGAALLTSSFAFPTRSLAEEGEFKLFRGMATPPTSYGGYGGNANEAPKYSFEYPASWKEEKTSKVEKGTQGVDGRVSNPRMKGQGAFVITLSRAGEDNKNFKLTDLESTFSSFAGADYNLQDAVQNATNTTRNNATIDGVDFYQYDIESPEFRYLSSIAVKNGKVFALFVRSPSRAFDPVEPKLRHIIETFRLL